ncbi:hypothetical protein AXG93_105s1010 [Marchantia polymorpha subsp. ruderalis]|uniref:Uncharacterized protein n=1 Tax=Marchantia polymorpha subsp. ruderalis TaxID=1480154 RepID=A0A176VJZ0_MARPO|nr:hypothetical protein AXG93_105s1010 [Marchantia polymorpha subsp. ruderalis]
MRKTPLAQAQVVQPAEDKGRKEETRVPLAQAPSAIAERTGEAGPTEERSPTPLEILAGSGAAVAAEEAARPSSKESPRISVATEILDSDDKESSEEEEVESVQGMPTGVLCEQVVSLLRYLDRKVAKYADPLHRGSYVKLVRNRTRTKVATNPELISLDNKYCELEEKNNCLQGPLTLSRKLNKTLLQMHDDKCKVARQADEELLRRLQSQCDELRAQRAEAELQLVEFEGDNRRATDRTREELVERVNRCLRGYTHREVAAQERITLRELELRAAALMSGDSRSRRRVAKRLDAFLSRLQDAIANLEAEVTAVLRRLGLRSRAKDWLGRELVRSRPSHRRHSR